MKEFLLNLLSDKGPPSLKRLSGLLLIITVIILAVLRYDSSSFEQLLWIGAGLVGFDGVSKIICNKKQKKDEENK